MIKTTWKVLACFVLWALQPYTTNQDVCGVVSTGFGKIFSGGWIGWNPYLWKGLEFGLVQSSVWRALRDCGSQSIDFSHCSFIHLRYRGVTKMLCQEMVHIMHRGVFHAVLLSGCVWSWGPLSYLGRCLEMKGPPYGFFFVVAWTDDCKAI